MNTIASPSTLTVNKELKISLGKPAAVPLYTKNIESSFISKKSLISDDDKKAPIESSKKNLIYWKQRYRSTNDLKLEKTNVITEKSEGLTNEKAQGSLKYVAYLQTPAASFNYTNIKLLKMFITKSGKIKPRRRTRISLGQQRKLSKAIRKARACGLLPFICVVRDIIKEKKRDRKKDIRRNRK